MLLILSVVLKSKGSALKSFGIRVLELTELVEGSASLPATRAYDHVCLYQKKWCLQGSYEKVLAQKGPLGTLSEGLTKKLSSRWRMLVPLWFPGHSLLQAFSP